MRHFDYKAKLEFNGSALIVQLNNYLSKIMNAYIVCDLNDWPNNKLFVCYNQRNKNSDNSICIVAD